MSLEQALADMTAAATTLNVTMQQHNALLQGLADKNGVTTKTNAATNTTAAAPKEEKKPAAKAEPPKITHETVAARVGDFIGAAAKGSEESKTRKDAIKRVLSHYNAPKVAELKPEDLMGFDMMVMQIVTGEDPLPSEEDDSIL